MKTDYQKQINDYKEEDSIKEKLDKINRIKELLNNKMKKHDYSEYSDNEIEDRIEEIEDIKIAISEACTNAVQYAYADNKGDIDIMFNVYEDKLEILIEDKGRGFDVNHKMEKGKPLI